MRFLDESYTPDDLSLYLSLRALLNNMLQAGVSVFGCVHYVVFLAL